MDPRLSSRIADATARAYGRAVTTLPPDVETALERALVSETDPVARGELENILENVALARKGNLPICQDTGVPVIYVTLPPTVPLEDGLFDAIAAGVRRATTEVPLRPNVVDPLTRHNTGDNTGDGMPAVHIRPGPRLSVTVLPKGAGAENMSRIEMLLPSEVERIPDVVVRCVLEAGARPCPPVVLGIGIGGTFDVAAALAKEALLEPIDTMDPFETSLCDAVNRLGIGPMGLGGATTALAVKVRRAHCHTASLPVAVNIQCWANRHATEYVEVDG
ncbi:MAG TPA: fumarate hydratase [Methanoregulaceae archaeon]|nr:fumarate hydratase [Methanoregulaceae archaeon]HOV67420.1 fumarate hydratase [Methanoregulaceae archaeon]HQJ88545.1 fumarate hydratase [Methanoregulaceae archaeon]